MTAPDLQPVLRGQFLQLRPLQSDDFIALCVIILHTGANTARALKTCHAIAIHDRRRRFYHG